jgi:hypothetical protein
MEKKNYTTTLLIMLIIIFGSFSAWAAPSVTGISGTVSNGQSVTISGSSFGSKSPAAPYLWDTVDNISAYSGVSTGTAVPVGSGYPWSANNSTSYPVMINKTSQLRGVRTANYQAGSGGSNPNCSGMTLGYPTATNPGGNYLYVTWWLYRGYSDSDVASTSNKHLRAIDATSWPGNYEMSLTTNVGCYLYDADTSTYLSGTTNGGSGNIHSWPGWPVPSTWGREELLVNSSSPAFTVGTPGTYLPGTGDGNYDTLSSSGGMTSPLIYVDGIGWDIDTSINGATYFGEIYIDNTWARVEACDASTWTARSHCEIQIPSAWSASSITATVNQGSFATGTTVYLYVLDSTNTPNASGLAITIGGGSSGPGIPTGLHLDE